MSVQVSRTAISAGQLPMRPETVADLARRIYDIPDATDEEALQAMLGSFADAAEASAAEAAVSAAGLTTALTSYNETNPPPRVVAYGDSQVRNGNINSDVGNFIYSASCGAMTWAQARAPRFDFAVWEDLVYDPKLGGATQGHSGYTGTQLSDATLLARVKYQNPRAVVCFPLTNSVRATADSAATIFGQYQAIITSFLDAGAFVIAMTLPPMASAGYPDLESTRRQKLADLNALVLAWAATKPAGVGFVDAFDLVDNDAGDLGGNPKTGYLQSDGIHYKPLAARAIGNAIGDLLETALPARDAFPDVLDLALNLHPNPTMTGSTVISGSNGANVSGNVATGDRVVHGVGTGWSVVVSLEANADTAGQSTVLTMTPGGAASYEVFTLQRASDSFDTTSLIGQDVVIYYEVEADGDYFRNLQVELVSHTGAQLVGCARFTSQTTEALGTIDNETFHFISPVFRMRAEDVNARPVFTATVDGAGTGTHVVKVKRRYCGPLNYNARAARNAAF